MTDSTNQKYASKIIKAGALLADTKTFLANWDDALSVAENLARFRRENIFGKTSRSRVEDILPIFRQRYLVEESVTKALSILVKGGFPSESLDRILYFHSARSDSLLHDTVTEVLFPLQQRGRIDVASGDVVAAVTRWVEEGKTVANWSQPTILRVVQGLMATLRDFGVLEGAVNKRLAPVYLPIESFAYVAFYLSQKQSLGARLVTDSEWRLFFLDRESVERFFVEAHQRRLLEYYAAGSVVRIAFPSQSLEEYARVILNAAH